MGRAKSWDYSDAKHCSTGTMQCSQCGKKITEGEFRYRQKYKGGDWHYVQHHRACCLEDPMWMALDNLQATAHAQRKALSDACREFKARWGVDELDDYIIEDTTQHPEGGDQ